LATVYLGLGSNLGERRQNLERALTMLSGKLKITTRSSIYETTSLYDAAQPGFLNMVFRAETELTPFELLDLARDTELRQGRTSGHNRPRPVDIDLLFYDDIVIDTEQLSLPHPRLAERAFVLVPLAEIAPSLVHPVSGKTISQMLADLPAGQVIKKYEEETCV